LTVSLSRHFCKSIKSISPVERETVAHGRHTGGEQWQGWGRCVTGVLGCGG
jgi:hypothetical protein